MEINLTGANGAAPAPTAANPYVSNSSDRAFKADVIDASLDAPVMVDFWAPWCGPCRQLTPSLEKVVAEKAGKIRLVKINIDENPAIAGQLGVQSIPAVFAFAGGRPIDGFMGALPESEVRKFADKVIAAAPAPAAPQGSVEEDIANAIAAAQAAASAGDATQAAQIYATVLQHQPENLKALLGMTATYLDANETKAARATLDLVPEAERKDEAYLSLAAAISLAEDAAGLADAETLRAKIAADPTDYQARFDLAVVLNAKGQRDAAAETLLGLMRASREWNDDGARKKLLELFEAWGAKDPATVKGRRQLSTLLFS